MKRIVRPSVAYIFNLIPCCDVYCKDASELMFLPQSMKYFLLNIFMLNIFILNILKFN